VHQAVFDFSEAAHLLRTNFRDFLLWMAAFLGTIFLGIEIGVAIAVGLSLVNLCKITAYWSLWLQWPL
jgi:MFS superfamily sulfate permease-like transporter